ALVVFFFALFFFAVSLFIIIFFVRLFPNDDISSYRAIRGFWVEVFWTYSAHCLMVRPTMSLSSFLSWTCPVLTNRREVASEISERSALRSQSERARQQIHVPSNPK